MGNIPVSWSKTARLPVSLQPLHEPFAPYYSNNSPRHPKFNCTFQIMTSSYCILLHFCINNSPLSFNVLRSTVATWWGCKKTALLRDDRRKQKMKSIHDKILFEPSNIWMSMLLYKAILSFRSLFIKLNRKFTHHFFINDPIKIYFDVFLHKFYIFLCP